MPSNDRLDYRLEVKKLPKTPFNCGFILNMLHYVLPLNDFVLADSLPEVMSCRVVPSTLTCNFLEVEGVEACAPPGEAEGACRP